MTERPITLYHAPRTRSTGVLCLLEELGAPYALKLLDRAAGETSSPDFRALNPLGKVPTLRDGEAVVTEQVAIILHLADLFPEKGLAPAPTDPLRGPYLRWMVFYAAAFEPALVDRFRGTEPGMRAMSPYGSYDEVIELVAAALEPGPWLLGGRFTAADVLWGTALGWTLAFKLVPPLPVFTEYAARVAARPTIQRAMAQDKALAEAQQKASQTAGATG